MHISVSLLYLCISILNTFFKVYIRMRFLFTFKLFHFKVNLKNFLLIPPSKHAHTCRGKKNITMISVIITEGYRNLLASNFNKLFF